MMTHGRRTLLPSGAKRTITSLAVLTALLSPIHASAQGTLEDYRRASTIAQRYENLTTGAIQGTVAWVDNTVQAVYRVTVPGGSRFMLVDADKWTKTAAFDHARVATALSAAANDSYTEITLPFNSVALVENGTAIEADVGQNRYRCTVTGDQCTHIGEATRSPNQGFGGGRGGNAADDTDTAEDIDSLVVASPDCRTVAFIQNYNIATRTPQPGTCVRRDDRSVILVSSPAGGGGGRGAGGGGGRGVPAEPTWTMLSTDGSEGDAYELSSIEWSPDSKKLVAYRQVPGYARLPHYIQSSPPDQVQPKLLPYDEVPGAFGGGVYRKAGDRLDLNQPAIFDVATKRQLVIDRSLFHNPYSISRAIWRKDGQAYTFQYNQRGHMVYRVLEVDANTGAVRPIVDEVTKSFFMYSDNAHNYAYDVTANCRLSAADGCDTYSGGEVLWASERDGWNHLYLYDGATGRVKNQVTKGNWVMRGVDTVDVANRQVYFRASGVNADQDPYFIHFYRINFDGTGLVAYTEGDGNHNIVWSPDRQFYIDTYSRVDMPPVVELKRASDRSTLALEKGDMSAAIAAGFRPPEVFVAKGRDGVTDIWGVIVRPVTFDPNRTYPVVESIYAGPHGSFVRKDWGGHQNLIPLAEIGFIYVQIDGMGTSNRSKAFHDVAWQNIADAGFPDRILWHKAVNAKYPWYDVSRVGIYGGSAGGQNAAGAVFFHPDFYDAAYASSGCHDNRMDKIWWNEAWMGEMGPHYEANSNVGAAKNLKGHIFLSVGELDSNVDPSSTLQVVNALLNAGKEFEMLVVPNGGHGSNGPGAFATRKRNDFFVKYLIGVMPPDWNSGASMEATGGRVGFDFPADDEMPFGFWDADPKNVYPFYWY
ncbi:MAG: prolyl oligopeptidase family serine peptidase [Gemmatimonadota bacterium]